MINRTFHLLIISLALLSCNPDNNKSGVPQTLDKPIVQQENKITKTPERNIKDVKEISEEYEIIVQQLKNKTLDSSSFLFDCNGEKAGKITFYREGDDLKMIQKIYNEYSHREGTEQYFISDGKPFFIFHKTTDWSFFGNSPVEGATKDNVNEKRFYIINNELVKCLEKQYVVFSSTKDLTPDQTANSNMDCPPIKKLLEDFKLLLSHKDQKADIKCL